MAASHVDINSLKLTFFVFNGTPHPTFSKKEHLEELYSFRPNDEDVVLSTYPKTGANWVMNIVLNLLDPENFNGKMEQVNRMCTFLESKGTKDVKPGDFYRTHVRFIADNFNPNAKYIIVLRNPKDVAVSYYHFSNQIETKFGDFPKDLYWFPRYAELFVKGEVWHGDYMEYHRTKLEGLRKHGKPENILYIVYEKMKKDPRGELERIANFLGGKVAERIKDEKVVETILERTSVESMRENSKRMQEPLPTGTDEPPKPAQTIEFVRKGVVGDHVNYFTPEISKMFDEYIASDPRNKEIMEFFEV